MHQRKGKKILIYFFLLILFGSINNISFNRVKYKGIENINVKGLKDYDNEKLSQLIENLNLENIYLLNKKEIIDLVSSNSLVEKYDIYKRYPSSLDVNIKKTKFLARINNNDKTFLIGSNGKLSDNNFLNNELPFIFGKPKIDDFLNFKEIIDQSNFSYNEIKNLYFFSSNRWDLELKNNILIRLPENLDKDTLQFILDFLNNNKFKDIKIVDARVENQIIIND
jgi:cell division protein FtsQ|tara:strand:- start:5770 stop:6441 length:672 start_codon:yes stop_codon:yes gene_type:complete